MKGKRCKNSKKGIFIFYLSSHFFFLALAACFGAVMGWVFPIHRQNTHKFDDLFPAGYTKKKKCRRRRG
jgi:hypothetical protein